MNNEFKKLLGEYVALQSISTDPAFDAEMRKTAEWLGEYLAEHGFKVSYLKGPRTNPVVFAEYIQSPELETVLVYGHYDVQPAKREDGWSSDPFVLTEKKGRLIGRGVVDNKGQNLIHIYTICKLIEEGKLAYNVKVMIEGNEETANPDMTAMVKKYQKLFTADTILISDSELRGTIPTMEVSLRGGFNFTITITTAKSNLHSGLAGGVAPSSLHEMARLIAKFYKADNTIAIPGFYAGTKKLSSEEIANAKKTGTEADVKKIFGIKGLVTEKGMSPYAQLGLRPTIQVSGIKSGYTGEGYSNIIPGSAEARVNVRVSAGQDPEKIYQTIVKFIKSQVPKYAGVSVKTTDLKNPPVAMDTKRKQVQEIKKLLKSVYKKEPLMLYCGASIPVVSDFKDIMGIDPTLVALGNDDCNMHGLDENFRIDLIEKGLAFSRKFFEGKN